MEKLALSELHRKVKFLHNPRHSAHKHSNTASDGPLKIRKGDIERRREKDLKLFIAEPSKVVFTDYTPGDTYEVSGDTCTCNIQSREYYSFILVHIYM